MSGHPSVGECVRVDGHVGVVTLVVWNDAGDVVGLSLKLLDVPAEEPQFMRVSNFGEPMEFAMEPLQ